MLWINKIYSVEPASHPILLFLKSPIFKIGLAFSLKYDKYLSDTVKDIITKQTRIHWLDRWIVRKELDIIPTYHYLQNQGKLMMQSQENGQKPQFEQILTISRPNISKLQIFLKNSFNLNWRSYLVLTSGLKSFKLFLRKISKCVIPGYLGDFFANISRSRIFFKNPALWLFYLYRPLTSCKKSEKSLRPFLRKLRYQPTKQPTNQPIITNNTDFIGPCWRRSNQNVSLLLIL